MPRTAIARFKAASANPFFSRPLQWGIIALPFSAQALGIIFV